METESTVFVEGSSDMDAVSQAGYKRTAIYARVAVHGQAQSSLRSQVEECYRYATSNGFQVIHVFEERFSGVQLDRPGLKQLRDMVNRREVDAVIVYTPDRLTRNLAHSLILCEEWQRAGIELHFVSR